MKLNPNLYLKCSLCNKLHPLGQPCKMIPTPQTVDAILADDKGDSSLIHNLATHARQLERENAELLEALEPLSTHGHAEDCLLLNRANQACDCGLDNAYLVIAKTKGKP